MKKEHKQLLKANSAKQSIFEAITGKKWEDIKMDVIIILIIILIIAVAVIVNYSLLDPCIAYFPTKCIAAIIFLIPEIMVLGIISMIWYVLCVELPVVLRRRHLPLTKEELEAMRFESDGRFYEFLSDLCSNFGFYVDDFAMDAFAVVNLYNESKGYEKYYLSEQCPESLRRYLVRNKIEMEE